MVAYFADINFVITECNTKNVTFNTQCRCYMIKHMKVVPISIGFPFVISGRN